MTLREVQKYKNMYWSIQNKRNILEDEIEELKRKLIGYESLLEENTETEVFLVPRINEVIGITQAHLGQWGWNMSDKGWINYPDYQTRILRNLPEIKWHNKVHEVIKGHKKYTALPTNKEYSLWHPKEITRQEIQNKYYDSLI